MTATIPNVQSASYAYQAEVDTQDIASWMAGFAGTGVSTGCAVTAQGTPNMTVAVASGSVLVAGASASVTGGNQTIAAADSANPRFDLIVSNSSGVVSVTQGTPAAHPVFPAIPASSVVLAAIYVPANATTITTAQIVDKRVVIVAAAAQTRPRIFVAASNANSNVKNKADYTCTGTNDHTTLNTAITAAQATGALVELSEGDFYLGATLAFTNFYGGLVGQGWGTVLHVNNSTNIYAITFTPPTNTSLFGAYFGHFRVECAGNNQSTGGGGINAVGAVQCVFDHLYINQPYDAGIKCNGDGNGGTGHHNRFVSCQFTHGEDSASGFGRGVWLTSSDENMFVACDFESNGRPGATDPANLAEYSGLQMISNCSFVGGRQGIKVQGDFTQITACKFDGQKANAVQVNGNYAAVNSNVFFQTGTGTGSPTFDGVNVDNVTGCAINSNTFLSDNTGTRSGINFANGATGNTAQGNSFKAQGSGYGSGAIIPGTDNRIRNNIGYKTEASGGGSISAATSITVTHGLATTPDRVFLTPTGDPGSGIRWWVSAKGSTTFTVTTSASATFTFDWQARVGDD